MAGDRRPVLSGELPFGCYSLYDELGLNKREANEMVKAFFDEIRGALSHSEQVKLSGFGNFDLRDKKERAGRNPKTGEEIPICVRRVVTFRPGQKLKAKVEAYVASSNKQMGTDLKSVPAWSLEVGDRLQVRPHLKSIPGTARSKPSNNNELPAIPGKRYFAIGEVAELCAVKAHVLRYWEQEFPISPRSSVAVTAVITSAQTSSLSARFAACCMTRATPLAVPNSSCPTPLRRVCWLLGSSS